MFWQCESEAVVTEDTQTETYIEILDPALALSEILNGSIAAKNETSIFKEINLDKEANKIVHRSGETSYTFALINDAIPSKTDNSTYTVDNLCIELNEDGSYTTYIFRYTPDMAWFNTINRDIDTYTGEVQLLDADW